MKTTELTIPTGGRQTSWLYTRMTRSWTRHSPRRTPTIGQSGIWIQVTALKSSALNHSAILPANDNYQVDLGRSNSLRRQTAISGSNLKLKVWMFTPAKDWIYQQFTWNWLLVKWCTPNNIHPFGVHPLCSTKEVLWKQVLCFTLWPSHIWINGGMGKLYKTSSGKASSWGTLRAGCGEARIYYGKIISSRQ